MSHSIVSIFLASSLAILISLPTNMASSPSLIQFACTNSSHTELCLRVLQHIPKVVAAKDLYNLSIAIIESGISYSTNTSRYVDAALNQTHAKPGAKEALQQCKQSYDQMVMLFRSALGDLNDFDYEDPDLPSISICATDCQTSLSSENVRDAIISRANRIVPIFGFSAFSVVYELDQRSKYSPPPTVI